MKPSILILGTGHLENPDNGDYFKTEVDDVLKKKRQEEISQVLDSVSRFKPTKIAVEHLKEDQQTLEQEYHEFLSGSFQLTRNEIHQIGFQLARKLGHQNIYAVDWNKTIEGLEDPFQWATNHPSDHFDEIKDLGQKMMSESEHILKTATIKDYLYYLNTDFNPLNEEIYKHLEKVGTLDEPVGQEWLDKYWIPRNEIIYENIEELVEQENERILVLYGAGHLYILKQLAENNGIFNVYEISDYLN